MVVDELTYYKLKSKLLEIEMSMSRLIVEKNALLAVYGIKAQSLIFKDATFEIVDANKSDDGK